jgi:hypothetical protein
MVKSAPSVYLKGYTALLQNGKKAHGAAAPARHPARNPPLLSLQARWVGRYVVTSAGPGGGLGEDKVEGEVVCVFPVNSVTMKEVIACKPQLHAPSGSTSSSTLPPAGSGAASVPLRAPAQGSEKGTHVLPMEASVATSEPSGASARSDGATPQLHVQEEDKPTATMVPDASAYPGAYETEGNQLPEAVALQLAFALGWKALGAMFTYPPIGPGTTTSNDHLFPPQIVKGTMGDVRERRAPITTPPV